MKEILYRLFESQYLGRDEARTILQDIATGKYNDSQIASLITVYLMRNISVEELTGFREALLDMRVPVDLSDYRPIDIVGTGGDGKNTFNISTAACFVVAGAGYHVVKHGNYGATSVSGASNVMEQHGVRFTADVDRLRRSMEACRIAYLHAPLFNPALKAVAPVRKSLGVRSFFNMLGPLVNPVMPAYQLLGVYNLPLLRLYSYTYQESGTRFAVVHSLDGYDEISLTAEFKVAMPETLHARDARFPACEGARPRRRADRRRRRPHLRQCVAQPGDACTGQLRHRQRCLRHPSDLPGEENRRLPCRGARIALRGESITDVRTFSLAQPINNFKQ